LQLAAVVESATFVFSGAGIAVFSGEIPVPRAVAGEPCFRYTRGFANGTSRAKEYWAARKGGRIGMKAATTRIQEALELKAAELDRVLRKRDDIAIEKSADQMDEIQYATERDLAIRNVDRESALQRQVKAALARIRDGSFGTCMECESEISPKRLAAVPWAPLCIQCQEATDLDRQGRADLVNAA
jgi:RNA polymerase-binding transcription factor